MTDPVMTPTEKAIIGAAIKTAAKEAGMIDPLDAELIFDRVRISENGFVHGEVAAIAALKKDRPHLFKPDASDIKTPAARRTAPATAPHAGPEDVQKKHGFDMSPAEVIAANRNSKIWRNAVS
jgi:hypothetical protein